MEYYGNILIETKTKQPRKAVMNMVKSKEFMTVESYLLKRYEELQRRLRQTNDKTEFHKIYSARHEIGETLVKCSILEREELQFYLDGINEKINLEMQGH